MVFLQDADGTVVSLPPLTNSERSKVSESNLPGEIDTEKAGGKEAWCQYYAASYSHTHIVG